MVSFFMVSFLNFISAGMGRKVPTLTLTDYILFDSLSRSWAGFFFFYASIYLLGVFPQMCNFVAFKMHFVKVISVCFQTSVVILYKFVPLCLKLGVMYYRLHYICTKVTLRSVSKVRYITFGRNKEEIFPHHHFLVLRN